MPSRLRPTAPIAPDAILVGDPGRALLLGQELLEEPKMSNHARGLWGYFGRTHAGTELTIQATGIGGPSAALVLGDLAELGVRRVVRVGTCVGLDEALGLGDLLVVASAIAEGGSIASFGIATGERATPDAKLTERLRKELGPSVPAATVASYDADPDKQAPRAGAVAADMQTASLLARARSLQVEAAAVLIATEKAGVEETLSKDALEASEKRAGRAASAILSA